MQVYVLTKGWRFQAVTLLQYTQSQVGSRRQRRRQHRELADGEAAASPHALHDIETASHKASVVPQDDGSSHSSAHDDSLASEPDAEQVSAGPGSHQVRQGLPEMGAQSAGGICKGTAGSATGRPATIIPHPGGPSGRWEETRKEETQKDSSRSLAASSTGSVGKTAVVVPEAARFAALKSATLWRQLVGRPLVTAQKLHAAPPAWPFLNNRCLSGTLHCDKLFWVVSTVYVLPLQVSPECIGMGFFFTVSVFVLQLYLGVHGVKHGTTLAARPCLL